ncbi:DUF6207 family protein [Streptomyces sp. NPDC003480]
MKVAACDDRTAFAVRNCAPLRRATASTDRTTRDPGEPSIWLRCYLDVCQELSSACRAARAKCVATTLGSLPNRRNAAC